MRQKIIISKFNNIAAFIKNNRIQELIVIQDTYQVNDIYIGIVQKIFTSIDAAFIQLTNYDRSGFIHINDIKNYNPFGPPKYISSNIKIRQKILVQIIKEPSQSKGPKLTTNIHLTGKYLILMPFNNTLHIAKKIFDHRARSFLHGLGVLIKPANIGLLFKESSQDIKPQILIDELVNLKKQWEFIQKSIIHVSCPVLIYQDSNIINKVFKEYSRHPIEQIIVDSKDNAKKVYELIKNYKYITTNTLINVYKHKEYFLDRFQINALISNTLNQKIELESGICIVIEVSEALTSIDVNSGSFNPSNSLEHTALKANCIAANEIAHQLILRNISGMIIVDFIDMMSQSNKLKLIEHFHSRLKNDMAYPEIIQLSELGLVELTRRRRGKSLLEIFQVEVKEYTINNPINQKTKAILELEKSYLNVNTIFFQKEFTNKLIVLKNYLCKHTTNDTSKIIFRSLIHSNIIPFELYSSLLKLSID